MTTPTPVSDIPVVILCGGLGTRLREATERVPKPLVDIGDRPILWHIMKSYAAHGITDFVVCLGYKGYVVKEYFANYVLHRRNVTFDLATNSMELEEGEVEPWRVTLVETGRDTMTGGRLAAVLPILGDEPFCMTYGDGVADVDVAALIAHHEREGRVATMTAVQPPARFGSVHVDGTRVVRFSEKEPVDGALINGGFFVLSPDVRRYLSGAPTDVWEQAPLERLTSDGELTCYVHDGFWHPMDTIRDRRYLEELWRSGRAPWTTHW